MAQFNAFTFGVISGRGWVCIALVVFGQWTPGAARSAPCCSPSSTPCSSACRRAALIHVPYQVFLMLPFVLTIVAMALVSRNARAPAALLKPFRKEER